ncbi:bifunctional hydroxymethylpyrimidine kinase/phosphomethylpyrimidine kinase [Haloarchaeobius sp. DFWS5]|uniref:bifunctional hydroxymethylpyrimidine kinase/phosphomethylpyrimidine kinase n=1 Tax=Haloarchaeobius sp. DFWS5 TaxID=3446114 RepID=UPI003EC0C385
MTTRQPATETRPVALTVAGSDSGGGAGIQADVKTMEAHAAFATSALTSVTAQHTRGVESVHVLPETEVLAQIDAVCGDFDVQAVKTGMLATEGIVQTVTDRLAGLDGPLVVDPVMVATSGDRLLDHAAERAYESLVAAATLVTPNADEAAVLTDIEPTDVASAREAGAELLAMGADAALVKGGHVPGDEVVDVLVTADDTTTFRHPRIADATTHGSGCTLSAAITARLAQGDDLEPAVASGIEYIQRAIRYATDVGAGDGAVNHFVDVRNDAAARETLAAVESVVATFVDHDIAVLVPEVGMNVVGALPTAETPEETVAVDGRITRTRYGVRPNGGVRFGASSHVARFLCAAREHVPDRRFAVNCRFGDDVDRALADLGWPIAEYDRADQPTPDEEGNTMGWAARHTFGGDAPTPYAVLDRGAPGKESMCKLVASDADTLTERTLALCETLSASRETGSEAA